MQFTEMGYAGTSIASDVWMTANPLNNTDDTTKCFLQNITQVDKY